MNYGNHAGSEDSNSEHSFPSYTSSPCIEVPCDVPKQYPSAFQHSGPVGSYGPLAFPGTGFYQNPRHLSSPNFHKAYYSDDMGYPLDLPPQLPCPSGRYDYWYKEAAVPLQRAQRPPDIRRPPSPAQWDHSHYRPSGLPRQLVSEQLKSWHRRNQLKSPRSHSLDRQGAVRMKNTPMRESTRYQSQRHEQVNRQKYLNIYLLQQMGLVI